MPFMKNDDAIYMSHYCVNVLSHASYFFVIKFGFYFCFSAGSETTYKS